MGSSAPQDTAQQTAASYDVYRRLHADIIDCQYRPGERLLFETLRARYHAGVGTLREALSHLVADGLVRTETGRGFAVAPVSVADLLDITEWRVEFEVRAVSLSIERGDDLWEAAIVSALHLLAKAEPPTPDAKPQTREAWGVRHRAFHDALAAACGSPWLHHFRGMLFDQALRYQRLSALYEPRARRKDDEHRELMNAVISRNSKLAADLIEQHIRRTADAVLKHLPGLGALKPESRSAKRPMARAPALKPRGRAAGRTERD